MGKTAFVFPGQGSQRVGMGHDLSLRRAALVETYYRRADEILGFELSKLCWEGPADRLGDMAVTQPAVLLTSLVMLDELRHRGAVPDVVAGHSLGEFSALVAAGVLEWTDALKLVRLRGILMGRVHTEVPGAMAAVVGLALPAVESLAARAAADTGEIVEVANHNEPVQIVTSGQVRGIERLVRLADAAGASKVVVLDVGGPAHCRLLAGIQDEFTAALGEFRFRDPVLPLVSGVTAAPVTTGADAVRCLRRQLTDRVRWVETVDRIGGLGVDRFLEVGPGRVLSRLCARIRPDAVVHRTTDARLLDAAAAALGGHRDAA